MIEALFILLNSSRWLTAFLIWGRNLIVHLNENYSEFIFQRNIQSFGQNSLRILPIGTVNGRLIIRPGCSSWSEWRNLPTDAQSALCILQRKFWICRRIRLRCCRSALEAVNPSDNGNGRQQGLGHGFSGRS